MSFTVLIPDNVHQTAIDKLKAVDGLTVIANGKLTQDELKEQIGEADAIVIRSGVKITADVLEHAPKLKAIARAGVGVDNIDLEASTAKGVIVMNTPGGNTISTAEHTLALMLALAHHIADGDASLRAGRWDRKAFMGVELKGKTLGIVGFGRIGRAVAARAQAFEMDVIAFDPFVPSDVFEFTKVKPVDMNTLFAESDFITLHTLITEDTREMINADNLAKMKDGVWIVNAARGALINSKDLADALDSGKVAGAALDVYEQEPPQEAHPLVGHAKVVHTPHLAASTSDAQVSVAVEAAELIIDVLLNDTSQNVVNPDVL